jgi:lipopolysaccharide heptosyltransferase I
MTRLLIVRMSALGDIVHALPVLSVMREAWPSAEIDWLADERYAGVLDLVDGVTNRVVVRPGYLKALSFMRGRKYDAALDLQGLIKSASAAWLSGAARIFGFETSALREASAAWFYSEAVPVPDGAHVIQKNLSVVAALGIQRPSRPRFPFVLPPSAAADRVADDAALRGPGRFVLMNAGGGWPNKRWPPDRFGALAHRIREEHGLPSYVLWGRGEEGLADAVVAASRGAAVRAPETTLGDLLALSARAALLVSGDTGPTHLAAAMRTPLVGLYGPTWPERNGPWDPADVVVSRAHECVCHHKRQCQRGVMCLDSVSVEDVAVAVTKRLAQARRT